MNLRFLYYIAFHDKMCYNKTVNLWRQTRKEKQSVVGTFSPCKSLRKVHIAPGAAQP